MTHQLPADCLNEILDYLEKDKITLYSCLLVNRLWCEIAVRILWKDVLCSSIPRPKVVLSLLSPLIACLPDESKDLLYKNGIFFTTSNWKPPLFNYASYCKILSINKIDQMIQNAFLQNLNSGKELLLQEILKVLMSQISSLKSLDYSRCPMNITLTSFPGAEDCLMNLTELNCCSTDRYSELSQICHNLQSLTIEFGDFISNDLKDLISLQRNLKNVTLIYSYVSLLNRTSGMEIITSSLSKFSLTLTKLKIIEYCIPLSFISCFINLQELILSYEYDDGLNDFDQLQYITFPRLKVLKFLYMIPKVGMLIKFLEINGKNLDELYTGEYDRLLNLAIAKFCPNLKTLFVMFINVGLDTLRTILKSCQDLESINIWCNYIDKKRFLEVLAKNTPKNFCELKIYYIFDQIHPEELEEFLINWKNHMPQRLLSLVIIKGLGLEVNGETMKIIEKYVNMGLVKFRIKIYDEKED
ncbi:hypothetical protein RclHR1_05180010 [Rhizophagus clarus]|uniref:F-box domain-containing protein n=1 Tax=Rhizophagus clarus TaxID=94130 RepID=A0A2Z6RRK3_9GLOM|nr:hypothetical protein RclHR1_05180010 [Rhizophagus clarus]GES82841.1 hypothetical protein GLOIN_2v1876445 [Rhizophagus clarus]